MAAYPEGAVGDADSSPGDGHGVFERGGWRVGALILPVAFVPHLYLHRMSLPILTDRQTDTQTERQTERWSKLQELDTTGQNMWLQIVV